MAASKTVLGPYSPKEFTDLATLNATITADLPAGTLLSVEPITVLGNIFMVVTKN